MGFSEQVIADNAAFISDFAEPLVYTPKGQPPLNISGVVDRRGEARISETQSESADEVEIYISVADVPIVTRGGDTVAVAKRVGGVAVPLTVRGIVSQDVGIWHLRCA